MRYRVCLKGKTLEEGKSRVHVFAPQARKTVFIHKSVTNPHYSFANDGRSKSVTHIDGEGKK
jgi:hypothetical protein